jgi:exosortase A-associated hydrolase 1
MGKSMRKLISFDCFGSICAASLDGADGKSGLFIVSGGNEIRAGAHRGMAKLAQDIAGLGHPVFRFDRRGIGDSEGENRGFTSSAQDLSDALAAFKGQCPTLNKIVAFGNCDAASAILLHAPAGIDQAILGNIWVIETQDEMPPPAAIKARYVQRMKDPKAWLGLFTGAINLRKLAIGLFKLAKATPPSLLADKIAQALGRTNTPTNILLAKNDATALAFIDAWQGPTFAAARQNAHISVKMLDSASHSFASDADYAALKHTIASALSG